MFCLLNSALAKRSAIYAAGPLDTGRLYYEAIAEGAEMEGVRAVNQQSLSAFVSHLRAIHSPTPVIDPGLLRVPEWTAREVGDFFLEVISRYAFQAWFIDGWEYSSGATKEYLHCLAGGVPCYTSQGTLLTPHAATELLRSAIEDLALLGVTAPKLSERLALFTTAAD